jgi:hypothetical protein
MMSRLFWLANSIFHLPTDQRSREAPISIFISLQPLGHFPRWSIDPADNQIPAGRSPAVENRKQEWNKAQTIRQKSGARQ